MKLTYRIGGGLASAAFLLSVMVIPTFAQTNVLIAGNGKNSTNIVNVANSSTLNISQTNSSSIVTSVNSQSSTGGNKANGNTGGNVGINTGGSTSDVNVATDGSLNLLGLRSKCCKPGETNISVTENGKNSTNVVGISQDCLNTLAQVNLSFVTTLVDSRSKTGNNVANGNTGGNVGIGTGISSSSVGVFNGAPSNVVNP